MKLAANFYMKLWGETMKNINYGGQSSELQFFMTHGLRIKWNSCIQNSIFLSQLLKLKKLLKKLIHFFIKIVKIQNFKKRNRFGYTRYIKKFIELGQLQLPPGEQRSKMLITFFFLKPHESKIRKYYKWGLANQLYKVHKKFHQARSVTATSRRANVKKIDKKYVKKKNLKPSKTYYKKSILQISYTRYIKNFIELSQLQQERVNYSIGQIYIIFFYIFEVG